MLYSGTSFGCDETFEQKKSFESKKKLIKKKNNFKKVSRKLLKRYFKFITEQVEAYFMPLWVPLACGATNPGPKIVQIILPAIYWFFLRAFWFKERVGVYYEKFIKNFIYK